MTNQSKKKFHALLHRQAQEFRKNPTKAEHQLWQALRRSQLGGFTFRRQHPIGGYIVDFVCIAQNVIIEVDGEIHNSQKEADTIRTTWLEEQGYQVLRFRNEQILKELDIVLGEILGICKERKT